MPVERGPKMTVKSAAIIGVAAVMLGIGLLALMTWLSSTGGVDPELGDDVFRSIRTEEIADEIAENGPVLLSDLAGGSRNIYVQHLGDTSTEGWYAFAVTAVDAPADCVVEWDADEAVFVDPCTDQIYPADGDGLPQYEVYLEDEGKRLVVDINGVRADATTTTATTSTTIRVVGDD